MNGNVQSPSDAVAAANLHHEREKVLEQGLQYKLTFHGTLDELIALARPKT